MRSAWLLLLVFHCLTLTAQKIKISTVNLYGNSAIADDTVLNVVGIRPGDSINHATLLRRQMEVNLTRHLPAIKTAMATIICCDGNGNYHLFIGIAENDTPILKYRPAPVLKIRLPDKYTNAYKQFSDKLGDAIIAGQAEEDWSQGYSLIRYAPARKIQDRFISWADADYELISKVLRSSSYKEERATAAQIIAYNPDKKKAVRELMYALGDGDEEVRNNAIRALSVISHYAGMYPEKNLGFPFSPFVRLIRSVVWSDRTKGLTVLMNLSKTRNQELFTQLKASSLPALQEMAEWQSTQHALPAFVILCRMANIYEEEIQRMTAAKEYRNDLRNVMELIK